MENRYIDERRKCRDQRWTVRQHGRVHQDGSLDCVSVIKKYRRNERVVQYRTMFKKQLQTKWKPVRSPVLFQQPIDWRFTAYRGTCVGPSIECGAQAFHVVAVECVEKVFGNI